MSNNIVFKDFFKEKNGIKFAGIDLIIDMWGVSRIDDIDYIKQVIISVIQECQVTLLNIYLHRFTPNGGVSGVVVLAESHISVRSWPEKEFIAFDVFIQHAVKPLPSGGGYKALN
jgi:S-adenosylmethionine decarboxylase